MSDGASSEQVRQIAAEMGKLIGDRVAVELSATERRLTDKVDQRCAEIMQRVDAVAVEQIAAGKSIVRIETRLDEGDKRFAALEERVTRVEGRERSSALTIAKLIGIGSAGGWAVARWFKS
jgi:hypothetical protein